jgi:cold shock protein
MQTGKVKWYNPNKGYGFIAPDGGARDVFVHASALQQAGIVGLADGQAIEFEVQAGRDGKESAHKLRLPE